MNRPADPVADGRKRRLAPNAGGRRHFARVVVIAVLAAVSATASAAVPTFASVVQSYRTSETRFIDRHGEVVQVLRTDPSVRRLAWTPLAEVSPALRTALVLSEDRRFYEHAGVDWSAVGAAAWSNLWRTRARGASTLSMQLAGLLDADLHAAAKGRSVVQKVSQAATAIALERTWRKDQILEAYVNLVGYRSEMVGIAAVSATLFEKYPSGLDAREAAITAALVRAPAAPAPVVTTRACALLQAQRLGDECRGLREFAAQALLRKSAPRLDSDPQLAPHFARVVLRRGGERVFSESPATGSDQAGSDPIVAGSGTTVTTTLDAGVQRFARATLRRHVAELAARNVEDGAVIVLDNASGEVVAWVGSSGNLSAASEVDHVLAPRQAGSTLKPFLYELAIEKRWLTAASLLDDSPVSLATANGLYIPQNYDHAFKGLVSVRTALASSLNVPAVRTLVMVTPERFHQRLRSLGLTTLRESGDYYGYALALGSAEVTLADLTNAYRALANDGSVAPIVVRPGSAVAARRAMDPGASRIVSDILADRNARSLTFGLESVLSTRRWSAVKTGTSKDMRDNWCIGFTDRFTIGVWVGNSSGAAMWDVSGTTGAAPIWQALANRLGGSATGSRVVDRADVIRRDVRFDGGLEAPRSELFLVGTDAGAIVRTTLPQQPGEPHHRTGAIAQPVDGTVVAIDPDIPPQRQRMTFASVAAASGAFRWRLDGKTIGRGSRIEWAVWPGRHVLELSDVAGTTVDRVGFEVRGATLRTVAANRD